MKKCVVFIFVVMFFLGNWSVVYEASERDNPEIQQMENTYELLIEYGVVKGYTGSPVEVVIPEDVREIGEGAFSGCETLMKVVISSGVETIESSAFSGCSNLKAIEIPESVNYIGGGAFNYCESLEEIQLPSEITVISSSLFYGCSSLSHIEIPDGVNEIGISAFRGCDSLESIEIPVGVSKIYNYTFAGCDSLAKVRIPETVTSIASNAFLDAGNVVIYGVEGSVAESFANEKSIRFVPLVSMEQAKVTLSSSVYTYVGNEKRPKVTVVLNGTTLKKGIDYTVTYKDNINVGTAAVQIQGIGNYTGSKTVNFTIKPRSFAKAVITLSNADYVYAENEKKPKVTVELDGTKLVKGTDYTVSYENNINVGTAKVLITGIGNYKDTVTKTFTIRVKAGKEFVVNGYKYRITSTVNKMVSFRGIIDEAKTSVSIPGTVTYGGVKFKVKTIADEVLKGNTVITKVVIGTNVKTIGERAFYGCKNLKDITIKSLELKNVEDNVFKGIYASAKIKVPSDKLSAYKKILSGKGQGDKVTIIGYN